MEVLFANNVLIHPVPNLFLFRTNNYINQWAVVHVQIAIFLYMPFSLYLSFYVTSNVEDDRPKIRVLRTVDSNAKEIRAQNNYQEMGDSCFSIRNLQLTQALQGE